MVFLCASRARVRKNYLGLIFYSKFNINLFTFFSFFCKKLKCCASKDPWLTLLHMPVTQGHDKKGTSGICFLVWKPPPGCCGRGPATSPRIWCGTRVHVSMVPPIHNGSETCRVLCHWVACSNRCTDLARAVPAQVLLFLLEVGCRISAGSGTHNELI